MVQLPAVDSYVLYCAQAGFAYAVATTQRSVRPSTSASSLSTTASISGVDGYDTGAGEVNIS